MEGALGTQGLGEGPGHAGVGGWRGQWVSGSRDKGRGGGVVTGQCRTGTFRALGAQWGQGVGEAGCRERG